MGAIIRTTMTWAEARNLAYPNPQLMPATYVSLRRQEDIRTMQIKSLVVGVLCVPLFAILALCEWPPIGTQNICLLMGAFPPLITFSGIMYGHYKIEEIRTQTALLAALTQDIRIVEQQAGHEVLARAIRATFIRAGNAL